MSDQMCGAWMPGVPAARSYRCTLPSDHDNGHRAYVDGELMAGWKRYRRKVPRGLAEDLAQLEATDPDVRAAAERLDATTFPGGRFRAEVLDLAEVDALRDELIELRAVRERVARVEAAGSPVCNCDGYDSAPTSPRTGAAMAHHCDCAAVDAAAALLGDRDKTAHVAECGCRGVGQ